MNGLGIIKKMQRYISDFYLSGSIKLLDHGLIFDDINDIDIFVFEEDPTKKLSIIRNIENFLIDNGYTGKASDHYGNIFSTQFVKKNEKNIDLNILDDKNQFFDDLNEILRYKLKRIISYKSKSDILQIKKIMEFYEKN